MTTNKTQPTGAPVSAFLDSISDPKRRADSQELANIMQDATGLEPYMWGSSIVGFGTHHYKYESGREGDTVIVGFAPRKDALTIYGVLFYNQNADLLEGLGPHTTGKGCIYIKDLSKTDKKVLHNMISVAYKQKT